MRRRDREPDPRVAEDLAVLDAALAGEHADPLVTLISEEARAWAPPMTPAFAATLDEAVGRGFAKPAGSPGARRPLRGRWLPAAGFAAAALIALVVVVANRGGGTSTTGVSRPSVGAATRAAGAPAPQAATAPEADLAAPAVTTRRVERAAQLTLSTPARRLQDTADAVVAVVDRMSGYVQSSDVAQATEGGQATFDLRVPTSRLDETLAALSRLGHVQSRSQQAQDITAQFASAASRLHDARAERVALLRALGKATTAQQTTSLRARLRIVGSEIAAARGDLAAARRRADLARVSVTVLGRPRETPGATTGHGRWTPGDALRDAVRVLGVAAGVAIVAAAALVPLALLAAAALLGGRAARRRRRESALDAGCPVV